MGESRHDLGDPGAAADVEQAVALALPRSELRPLRMGTLARARWSGTAGKPSSI
jgi:hypothetical protein